MRFKIRREELAFTQDLADKAPIHRTYLSDVERGTRNDSLINIDLPRKSTNLANSREKNKVLSS